MSEVKIFKLISGEEVIAKVVQHGMEFVKVSSPRCIQMFQDHTGQPRAGLAPWIMSSPDAVLNMRVASFAIDPIPAPSDIERGYLSNTSGIQISQSLMG